MITVPCQCCKGTGLIDSPALTRVLDAVSPTEWRSTPAVADEVDREPYHVADQLRDLHRRGLIERRGKGSRSNPYEWRRL